jgi:hypothetical protein
MNLDLDPGLKKHFFIRTQEKIFPDPTGDRFETVGRDNAIVVVVGLRTYFITRIQRRKKGRLIFLKS